MNPTKKRCVQCGTALSDEKYKFCSLNCYEVDRKKKIKEFSDAQNDVITEIGKALYLNELVNWLGKSKRNRIIFCVIVIGFLLLIFIGDYYLTKN